MRTNGKENMIRKSFTFILAVLMLTSCFSISAFAGESGDNVDENSKDAAEYNITDDQATVKAANINCTCLSGNNINDQDYYIHSEPVCSYLTVTDNGYMRVQRANKTHAVYYDQDFNVIERKIIPEELPVFGGFYESADNYYIVTGNENYKADTEVEEIRITKYTKDWEKAGSDSLYNSNTVLPFQSGSLRMCMVGKYLYIRSCHQMYNGHQANIMIVFDTDEVKITDYRGKVSNISTGYVSHSFNQFIQYQDGVLYGFDHGDAYPRAGVITCYKGNVSNGTLPNKVQWCNVKEFDGEIGDNETDATFGSFEVGSDHVLVAGTLVAEDRTPEEIADSDYYDLRDVVLYSVGIDDDGFHDVKTVYLTSNKAEMANTYTPHLVKTGENEYIVLWTAEQNDYVYYVKVNGQAELLSDVHKVKGSLSDCKPIVVGSKLIWYTWESKEENFYKIDINDISNVEVIKKRFDHDYIVQDISNGIADMQCSKCGETTKGCVPTSFIVRWSRNDGLSSTEDPKYLQTGDELFYFERLSYASSAYKRYAGFIVESSDPDNCEIGLTNRIAFHKAGTYTITMYPAYNPKVKKTVKITVKDDTDLRATGKMVMVKWSKLKKSNQTILRSKAVSVANNFNGVKFKKVSGNKKITVSKTGKITLKRGMKKGKYRLKVKVIDKGGPYFKRKSVTAAITLTIA